MKPRVTLITLGVDDLKQAVAFYCDGLGSKTEGIVGEQFGPGRPFVGSGVESQ